MSLGKPCTEPEPPAVKWRSDPDFLRTLGSPANAAEVPGNLLMLRKY